jgi:hypothetical protein
MLTPAITYVLYITLSVVLGFMGGAVVRVRWGGWLHRHSSYALPHATFDLPKIFSELK